MLPRQPEPEYMDLPEEAEAYARADFSEVNQAFVDRLVEWAGPCRQARALDLGTGPADIPMRLLERRPHWRVVAADASLAMLKLAVSGIRDRGLSSSLVLVLGDAKRLPLASKSFDVIFSNSILHHISATEDLWWEVKRLARPGAVVFVRDLARPATAEAARCIVERHAGQESPLLQEAYYRSLLAAYTPDEVRSQLAKAGLGSLQLQMITDRHMDIAGRCS
ncbi:MAG: methyltransferase domain-containing protein [Phycisphaerae bacterium]|nr:methyltransferase domain-containing protein [Phycisphaerae bacterium]